MHRCRTHVIGEKRVDIGYAVETFSRKDIVATIDYAVLSQGQLLLSIEAKIFSNFKFQLTS